MKVYSKDNVDGRRPCVYLSLRVDPRNIDVNVHQNKERVALLNQDQIIEAGCAEVEKQLSGTESVELPPSLTTRARKVGMRKPTSVNDAVRNVPGRSIGHFAAGWIEVIKELIEDVKRCKDRGPREILRTFYHLALKDPPLVVCAMFSQSKVYCVRGNELLAEAFYQISLASYQNFGTLILDSPVDLHELVEMAFSHVETLETRHTELPSPLLGSPHGIVHALI